MPTSGYVINEEKTYCQTSSGNEVKGKIKTVNGIHGISGLNKGDKCYLYFDKKLTIIIGNNEVEYKTTQPNFSKIATDDEGVFETDDGTNMYSGKTYYWRGAATTNHVIFANKCWRIVRINGDKTLRLIYNGTPDGIEPKQTCPGNGANADAVIIGSSNSERRYATSDAQYNNPSYVGWTYSLGSQRPNLSINSSTGLTEGGTASNAKVQTEKWYDTNIGNNPTYASKVADGKFCNDREIGQPLSGDTGYVTSWSAWQSNNSSYLFYAGRKRLYEDYSPTLNCNAGDVYTLKVGAITADEAEFAGGKNENNTSYYLYNDQAYWTMSPSYWDGTRALMFRVGLSGSLNDTYVDSTYGLRPVINLKADTTFSSGDGAQNTPYIVS